MGIQELGIRRLKIRGQGLGGSEFSGRAFKDSSVCLKPMFLSPSDDHRLIEGCVWVGPNFLFCHTADVQSSS